ncbi:hypothetical protein D9613_012815 [Agrocybe pediades]|uniref:Uncharacterized protein n=1 Tax=Agrocybe pediades TaxID=84607 RepID=A0A8H4VT03_9AGAR|nr:hypothetical protein D9613_012815 [Agrocybe pediades]
MSCIHRPQLVHDIHLPQTHHTSPVLGLMPHPPIPPRFSVVSIIRHPLKCPFRQRSTSHTHNYSFNGSSLQPPGPLALPFSPIYGLASAFNFFDISANLNASTDRRGDYISSRSYATSSTRTRYSFTIASGRVRELDIAVLYNTRSWAGISASTTPPASPARTRAHKFASDAFACAPPSRRRTRALGCSTPSAAAISEGQRARTECGECNIYSYSHTARDRLKRLSAVAVLVSNSSPLPGPSRARNLKVL